MAVHYPTDYDVFALVRTNDQRCKFPDDKVRQRISDKLGVEFVGTLEMDEIIYTMLDLEQMIGRHITWVTGETFEDVIRIKSNFLPNRVTRYCTTWMKTYPILKFILDTNIDAVMNFGFRVNEVNRKNKMVAKLNKRGYSEVHASFEKHQDGRNKWSTYEYCRPNFPLIDDLIDKREIDSYWKIKGLVNFAVMNNCVGCFWRNEMLLKKMTEIQPVKMQWFEDQEKRCKGTFRNGITYEKIRNFNTQLELDFADFNDCDSGTCGL